MSIYRDPWWKAAKGKVHARVFETVRSIENEHGDVFDRHVKLEALYDPYSPRGDDSGDSERRLANVQENVVAANVDTVHAAVATTEVRARFMTDGAEWSMQRRARHLELYGEGIAKLLGLHKKCRLAFKAAAKKGNGVVKVFSDRWKRVRAEHVPIEDIMVPDCDARDDRPPMQLHHVMRSIDKEELVAEYPEHEEAIRGAHGRNSRRAGVMPVEDGKIVVIHSWRLPIGKKPAGLKKGEKHTPKKGEPKYVAGRETICIEGKTLLDREYHKPYYPLACISWLSREGSFYGISLTERIAGIQRALNKRNWQIDRGLDLAVPTTYFRPADAGAAIKTTKIGNVGIVKGDYPHTSTPPAVHPEVYKSRVDLKDAAFEESGVSRLAAQSHKPAGLDSGRALREYRDQTTQRFAPQEQDFEQLVLDSIWLALDACKDLGSAAPTIVRTSRWQPVLPWEKVDMDLLKVQITAASTLNRTSAGREQTLIEWAQAGVISTDDFRRMIGHPDLERAMSLYTAAMESIDEQLEMILDGEIVVPEPFDNLEMARWRGTQQYHLTRPAPKVPEDVLEALRQYVEQAVWLIKQREAANGNAAVPGAPIAADPMASQAPASPPVAALAPQAMDTIAA